MIYERFVADEKANVNYEANAIERDRFTRALASFMIGTRRDRESRSRDPSGRMFLSRDKSKNEAGYIIRTRVDYEENYRNERKNRRGRSLDEKEQCTRRKEIVRTKQCTNVRSNVTIKKI